MKTPKIIIIVTLILAVGIGSVVVLAGNNETAEPQTEEEHVALLARDVMPDMIMGHLKDRLNLTEEQETQVLQIIEETIQTHSPDIGKFRGFLRQRWHSAKVNRQDMWQEVEGKLAEVLTDEQMKELTTMRDEFQGRIQEMEQTFAQRSQVRGEFHQLIQDLNLTKEQKIELMKIVMKNRENRQQIMETMQEIRGQVGGLALQMLNEEFDETKVRETYRDSVTQMEDLVVAGAKMFAEMKTVLTPEQLELLQQRGSELLQELQESSYIRHSMFKFRRPLSLTNN